MIAMAIACSAPAPTAWIIRKTIREFASQEIEQRKEPPVNAAEHRIKRFLFPSRLPNHPTDGVNTVRVIINPVRTQWI